MPKQKLYKVLVNMKSCHGGDMTWEVGKWYDMGGKKVEMCKSGFHLTNKPYQWYQWGCTCYEAEAEGISEWDEDKCVCKKVRLIKEVPHPKWWLDAIAFVDSIKSVPWFKNDGKPLKSWKLFDTRAAASDAAGDAASDAASDAAGAAVWDAARDAAGAAARAAVWDAAGDAASDAARAAVWDAAGDAAWDAALMSQSIVVEWNIDDKHVNHVKSRMQVWQKGYGLLCDVNGVLYVYKQP